MARGVWGVSLHSFPCHTHSMINNYIIGGKNE
jgi:hypothetical protein